MEISWSTYETIYVFLISTNLFGNILGNFFLEQVLKDDKFY